MAGSNASIVKWCLDEIGARFVQVLESMTEQKHSVRYEAGTETLAEPLTWWRYAITGGIESNVSIGAPESCWNALGGQVLAAAGVDSDPDTAQTTFSEIATQALSAVGQSIGKKAGRQCDFQSPQPGGGPGNATLLSTIVIIDADTSEHAFALAIDPSLLCAFEDTAEHVEPAAPRQQSERSRQAPDLAPAGGPPTLGLLMDVELPVSVSFGRAQLQIKDVMKLASGSIIELNRHVAEPAEIVVNNCVIARGEVVVVEGNYGVRIDEIISPQERLRTLK
jgi:flagellar motor switch protein FliN/FliY